MYRPTLGLLALAAATLITVGCGDDTPVTPTQPTPTTVTETFSGTLTVNGAMTHRFATQSGGSAQATLTAVGPDTGDVVGFAMGTWSGSTCQLILTNDAAVQTSVITGTVGTSGQLCIRVYDVGQLTGPVDYEVTVVHP
ncbi:MAG: hypothetical protein AB7O67_10970 [Vicinamibacterales bacterium]